MRPDEYNNGQQPTQLYTPPLQQPQPIPVASSPYASVDQSVFQKRQSLAKTLSIAVGVIILLVSIGVSIASFMATQRSVTLERYEGDGYSILVPKEYEKETNSNGAIWTSEKYTGENGKKNVASRMAVFADYGSLGGAQELMRQYDNEQQYILEAIVDRINSVNDGANMTLRDVETKKDDHRGLPARSIAAKVYSGDKMTGTFYVRTIFTEKGMYMIVVAPHQQVESGFRESAQEILDSFEIKG
ncbi:MAG: hypothetical protein Q4A37_03225 [Candidatus Saccharibacteria bacterium]|nr:hypothetical protein [Candidatus Saccharibacteria bacterium]